MEIGVNIKGWRNDVGEKEKGAGSKFCRKDGIEGIFISFPGPAAVGGLPMAVQFEGYEFTW